MSGLQALDELVEWKDNYNVGDVQAIVRSIRRFGFNSALRVWRDHIVIAGNHSMIGLRQIEKEGPRPDLDGAWPPKNVVVKSGRWSVQTVDVSHLDELEAKAYAIADNHLARQAVTNDALLADYLKAIQEHDAATFAATGFTDEAFKAMMEYLAADMIPDDSPEYDETVVETVRYVTCPHCGQKFPL